MQRELGKSIPQGPERIQFLRDNSEGVEKKTYMKHFSPEELSKQKDQLSDVSIEINALEEELAEIKKQYKDQLSPLVSKKKEILKHLRDKAELVTEECFKIVDTDERKVGYYNDLGDMVESRPAYREELQLNLFIPAKTGTND